MYDLSCLTDEIFGDNLFIFGTHVHLRITNGTLKMSFLVCLVTT